jgi:hypothetical protein
VVNFRQNICSFGNVIINYAIYILIQINHKLTLFDSTLYNWLHLVLKYEWKWIITHLVDMIYFLIEINYNVNRENPGDNNQELLVVRLYGCINSLMFSSCKLLCYVGVMSNKVIFHFHSSFVSWETFTCRFKELYGTRILKENTALCNIQ